METCVGRFDLTSRTAYISNVRRRSLFSRANHSLFAILAVWCLGCSSFDMFLDSAFGVSERPGPTCMSADMSQGPAQSPAVSTLRSENSQTSADGCGCSHCAGVRTLAASVSPVPQAKPKVLAATIGRALRVDREPLVPPPQGSTRV
jgi:hypothetical protein